MHEYEEIIDFIRELERLKDTTRTAWTKEGRAESVAEHSWRLALFALSLGDYFGDIDLNKVMRMCLVHDMGEAYEGDISAKIEENKQNKFKREEAALLRLTAPLPENIRKQFLALWLEYNDGETEEAKLAKALDKMETIIQHNQGNNPGSFDYEFNLQYGKEYAFFNPVVRTMREIVDKETRSKMKSMGCEKLPDL
jgi:putative hydrolase of HD superfamily